MRKQDEPVVRFEKRGREFFLVARVIPLEEPTAKASPLWGPYENAVSHGIKTRKSGSEYRFVCNDMESLLMRSAPGKAFLNKTGMIPYGKQRNSVGKTSWIASNRWQPVAN